MFQCSFFLFFKTGFIACLGKEQITCWQWPQGPTKIQTGRMWRVVSLSWVAAWEIASRQSAGSLAAHPGMQGTALGMCVGFADWALQLVLFYPNSESGANLPFFLQSPVKTMESQKALQFSKISRKNFPCPKVFLWLLWDTYFHDTCCDMYFPTDFGLCNHVFARWWFFSCHLSLPMFL